MPVRAPVTQNEATNREICAAAVRDDNIDRFVNAQFTPPDPTQQNCLVASRRVGRCGLNRR